MVASEEIEAYTQTTGYPEVRVRRTFEGGIFAEEWRIMLADGEPAEIQVRPIQVRTIMGSDRDGGAETVERGEWYDVRPRYVPGEVVAKVEKHMVPRGQFA